MPSGGNSLSGQDKTLRRGEKIRADTLNRLGDSTFGNQTGLGTVGLYGGRFPGGGVLISTPPPSAGTAGAVLPPWFPFYTQDNSGNYQANFYPGTIGGVLPSNIFSALALTQSVKNYVYAQMTASAAGVVTAATLAASTSYPGLPVATSGSTPTSFNIPIGIFDLSASPKAWNIVGFGNIWAQPYVALFTTVNNAALMTAPFTPSYSWLWGAGD